MSQDHSNPEGTIPGTPPDPRADSARGTDSAAPAFTPTDPYSRRRFLRAAVIGAAGVAGAAGAAGVVLAHGNLPAVVALTNPSGSVSFHDPGCSGCVTDSGFKGAVGDTCGVSLTYNGFQIDSHGSAQDPGDFYIWFTAPNLPAGTYNVTFTPDPNFSVKGANPYFRDVYNGGAAPCCPTTDPKTGALSQTNGASISAVFPYTVPTTSPATTQDLQLQVHMTYTGGVIGASGTTKTFTFSATFTASGQTTPVCSESVQIVGTQQ